MEIKDLFIAPFVLALVYGIAYAVRDSVTDAVTKQYFIKGLNLKIMGGLVFGLVYQFYYGGGDTFEYYYQGKIIYDAFFDSPSIWYKLVTSQGEFDSQTVNYATRMYWYNAPAEYNVIRVAGIFALFSLNTFTGSTVLFSAGGYIGIWAMYKTFYTIQPKLHQEFAYASFYIPSYYFWGSGIMKDTVTIMGLGLLFFGVYELLFKRTRLLRSLIISAFAAYLISGVKVYVLLGFVPALMIWLATNYSSRIKSKFLRSLLFPFVMVLFGGLGYVALNQASSLSTVSDKYSIEKMASTAATTAWWLSYVSELQDGSGYSLGEVEYTPVGMLKKAPAAIVVSLFRPYPWEVRKPIMLMTSIEALFFLFLTLRSFWRAGIKQSFAFILGDSFILFCTVFTLIMAFTTGISSYNFGSLARYKIPFLPFYVAAIYMLQFKVDEYRQKKAGEVLYEEKAAFL